MAREAIEQIEQQFMHLLRRITLSETRDWGLDRSAYVLLTFLQNHGASSVKEMADQLQLDISTVSRQAASLLSNEFVEKVPNSADKRSYFYEITSKGFEALVSSRKTKVERLEELLHDWETKDVEQFGEYLKRYNESAEKGRDR